MLGVLDKLAVDGEGKTARDYPSIDQALDPVPGVMRLQSQNLSPAPQFAWATPWTDEEIAVLIDATKVHQWTPGQIASEFAASLALANAACGWDSVLGQMSGWFPAGPASHVMTHKDYLDGVQATPSAPDVPFDRAVEIFAHLSVSTLETMERYLRDPETYRNSATEQGIVIHLEHAGEVRTCPLGIPILASSSWSLRRSYYPSPDEFAYWAVHNNATDLDRHRLSGLASRFMSGWDRGQIDRLALAAHLGTRIAVARA